jgi:hypothetical protein
LKCTRCRGIGAVQRLVENQDLRLVNQRRREPHALAHSARVGIHRAVLGIFHVDERDRLVCRRRQRAHSSQAPHHFDELAARHEAVDCVVLGHHTDAPVERRIVAHRFSEDGDRSARRISEAGHHAQQRRLARAIRSKQSGDSR